MGINERLVCDTRNILMDTFIFLGQKRQERTTKLLWGANAEAVATKARVAMRIILADY
jgi:hypothetical protein